MTKTTTQTCNNHFPDRSRICEQPSTPCIPFTVLITQKVRVGKLHC